MKNVLKRRVAPLIGIVAMLAAIGFMMTACGGEEEAAPPPSGTVSIEAEYGAFTDYPLTAKWSGTENVMFLWCTSLNKNNLETVTTVAGLEGYTKVNGKDADGVGLVIFNPKDAGSYYVAAVSESAYMAWGTNQQTGDGKTPFPQLSFSSAVSVSATKPAYAAFLGKWEMKGSENFWKPANDLPNTPTYSEFLTITPTSIKLDSDYSNVSGKEYAYWNISNWGSVLSGADLTASTRPNPTSMGGSAAAASNVTYASGFDLTVSGGTTNGYDPAQNYTSFRVYLFGNNTPAQLRRSNDPALADPVGTRTVLGRVYKQTAKPEDITDDSNGSSASN